jgi:hypothetical protein
MVQFDKRVFLARRGHQRVGDEKDNQDEVKDLRHEARDLNEV